MQLLRGLFDASGAEPLIDLVHHISSDDKPSHLYPRLLERRADKQSDQSIYPNCSGAYNYCVPRPSSGPIHLCKVIPRGLYLNDSGSSEPIESFRPDILRRLHQCFFCLILRERGAALFHQGEHTRHDGGRSRRPRVAWLGLLMLGEIAGEMRRRTEIGFVRSKGRWADAAIADEMIGQIDRPDRHDPLVTIGAPDATAGT